MYIHTWSIMQVDYLAPRLSCYTVTECYFRKNRCELCFCRLLHISSLTTFSRLVLFQPLLDSWTGLPKCTGGPKGVNLTQKVGGGTDSKLGKSGGIVCYPNLFLILVHWNGIASVLEALIKLYYNVHDLKFIFNHVRNPLKINMS
jgi:hypothetical protein